MPPQRVSPTIDLHGRAGRGGARAAPGLPRRRAAGRARQVDIVHGVGTGACAARCARRWPSTRACGPCGAGARTRAARERPSPSSRRPASAGGRRRRRGVGVGVGIGVGVIPGVGSVSRRAPASASVMAMGSGTATATGSRSGPRRACTPRRARAGRRAVREGHAQVRVQLVLALGPALEPGAVRLVPRLVTFDSQPARSR